jgi:F0F1-type ATP synthase assembly protein I
LKIEKDSLNQALQAVSAGMEMAISIIAGSAIGYVVGGYFSPEGSYIGLMIGAALGLISGVYRLYKKYG